MIRPLLFLAAPLFFVLCPPAGAQSPPAGPVRTSDAPAPGASAEGRKNNHDNLLSNPIPGRVDDLAKPSLKEILERQRLAGMGPRGSISPENYAKLEALYVLQQYETIGNYLARYSVDAEAQEWIRRKASDGSVPMMWMLADRYASVQTIDLAVKWGHAALLGSIQERSTCLDGETDEAAAKISSQHPHLTTLTRGNPFLIKESKIFAMDVLATAARYPDPIPWLCKPYSSRTRQQNPSARFAYDPIYFPHLRAKARNALRKKYQIDQPLETLPPLPEPPKPGP